MISFVFLRGLPLWAEEQLLLSFWICAVVAENFLPTGADDDHVRKNQSSSLEKNSVGYLKNLMLPRA
jgi:hypothetical protein